MQAESLTSYGKEPFDLWLTVLRMIRNLPIIIGFTVLGMLLFGGGYYVKNVLLNRDTTYTVTSTYKVSYVDEPSKSGDYYINEMTWNTYVQSKEFLEAVWEHLGENTVSQDTVFAESAEELAGVIQAKLASDLHVPSTVITTESQEGTVLIAKAVEQAMVQEFVESNEQVAAITVIDPAITATEVVPDVRPVRAFVLSGILSLFFVVVLLLLKELGDDSIWLPATLRRRYGLVTIGTVNSPEARANMEYLFGECPRIMLCPVVEEISSSDAINTLMKIGKRVEGREWISVPVWLLSAKSCEAMREAGGVLLVVKAGCHAGKPLEYALEYLATQEIKVKGAVLWDADEWLLKTYYRLSLVGVIMPQKEKR